MECKQTVNIPCLQTVNKGRMKTMNEIVDVASSINLILLLAFALLVVYIYFMLKLVKMKPKEKQKKSKQHETTQEEFEQILMKLFTMGIISQQEYNRLLVNGLPHFK